MKGVYVMKPSSQIIPDVVMRQPEFAPGQTTLYDLIDAVSEEVQPEENELLSEIVLDLLKDCRPFRWIQ
jgi:hypothetical protein